MGIPQQDSAVFYHPLDDRRAGVFPAKWSGDAGFAPGAVNDAAFGEPTGEIVFGPQGALAGGSGNAVDMRDDDSFVLAYAYTVAPGDFRARARLGSIDPDGVISYGAEYDFFTSTKNPGHFRVNWLDSSRFLVSWRRAYDDSPAYQALGIVGVVTGADVTFGAQANLNDPAATNGPNIELAVLSDTKAVYVFSQSPNPNYAWSSVATITGDAISMGGQEQVSDISMSGQPVVAPIDSTRFVLVYASGTFGTNLQARVGTVVGSNVTWGSWWTIDTASGSPAYTHIKAVELVGDDRLLFCYNIQTSTPGAEYQTRVKFGKVNGTDINYGVAGTLFSSTLQINGWVDYARMTSLDAGSFALQYEQQGQDVYVKICDWSSTTPEVGGTPYLVTTGSAADVFGRGARSFLTVYSNTAKVGYLLGDVSLGYEAGVSDIDAPDNEFLASAMFYPAMALLDPTTLVVGYTDSGNSNHGTVKLATVIEDAVSFGSPHEFLGSDGANDVALAALDSTRFVVAYRDESSSGHGTCKVGLVTGADITFGAEYEFESADYAATPSLSALGADKFVVGYKSSTQTVVRVGEVGGLLGLDITWGAPAELQASVTTVAVAATDPSTFVAVYNTHARLGTVVGATVTLAAQVTDVRANGTRISAVALTDTLVATCYGGGDAFVQVLAVAGGTVEAGPEVQSSGPNTGQMGMAALDSTHVVLCYVDSARAPNGALVARAGTVAGMSTTFKSERDIVLPPRGPRGGDHSDTFPVVALAAGRFVVAYGNTYGPDGSLASSEYSGHLRIGETDFSGELELSRMGAVEEFSADEAPYTTAALLAASSAVVAYMDTDNSGKVAIATISGTDVVFGAPAQFHANARETTVVVLDSTHFAVCFADAGDSGRGKSLVGVVTGTNVTFGSIREFNGGNTGHIHAAALDSTKFVVCFQDGDTSGTGIAVVGVVSGNSITFEGSAEFCAATPTSSIKVVALGATSFVVAYQDSTDSGKPKAKVGTVSGGSVIFGFEAEISVNESNPRAITALDASRVAVAMLESGDVTHGRVKVGIVSGTDITFGPESVMDGMVQNNSLVALNSQRLVVVEKDAINDSYARLATVVGTTVSWHGASVLVVDDVTNYWAVDAIDSSRFITHFSNNTVGNSRSRIGILEPEPHATSAAATKVVFMSWLGS